MNNFPNLYFDYVGSTGEHSITDFIIESSNNNFLYTSNSSNFLNQRIEDIDLETSNISSNISSNYTSNLRYDINKLIKEENENIITPVPYQKKHTYIYNSNLLGEIRFYCESSKDFIVVNPEGVPLHRTKIDVDGKLKVYYTYDPAINLTFGNGWVDVVNSIVALNASDANIGITIGGLQAEIFNNFKVLEGEINALILGLTTMGLTNEEATYLRDLIRQTKEFRFDSINSIDNFYNLLRDAFYMRNTNLFNTAINVIGYLISTNPTIAFFLGVGGVAYGFIYGALQNINYLNTISSSLKENIYNNSNITTNRRTDFLSSNFNEDINTYVKLSSNIYNLAVIQGFINSNIITQQYIPLLNVNEIKINQTNISNIISSSSNINYLYSSNNSNLLFNNIGISSNNNYIYSSNNIDKINILLPNSSFWYDANFGGIWCYDLNIEKYVKATILPNNYKYRSFRITTYQSKSDWKNGYNLYGAGIAGEYINFPETLTIHMNNNKQIGGISTADDTYSNGIILGKTKNSNIGYWNILKDNFNYLRYITKVGWDLVCVIEIL